MEKREPEQDFFRGTRQPAMTFGLKPDKLKGVYAPMKPTQVVAP